MQCMKCGRDIEPDQVFCPGCLEDMEKYPVKPGTVVQLPRRSANTSLKKQTSHRHPAVSLEEQVKRLKKAVRNLILALVLCAAAIIGLCFLVADQYMDQVEKFLPGQNYSSVTDATDTTQ